MKKRLNHEKKLEFILADTTKKFFKYKGFHIFKLISLWQDIVKDYSNICTPINILKQQNINILILEVEDEALIFELEYNKDHIICLINQYFGSEHIHKLKFKLALQITPPPKPAKKAKKLYQHHELSKDKQEQLEEITDNKLKEKLSNLFGYFS